ncbi:MAG TPA: hypothetical protein PKD10_03655 [Paracoccaceae bacterium]|nr:hypothetical protein [Paracoccaceae bacterium]HMO70861.1 hypothetical protein [Paracoccaceae bacterium]
MKFREDTHARLVVEDRPWALGIGLGAAITVFAGIALFTWRTEPVVALVGLGGALLFALVSVLFVRRSIVIFDRATGRAIWREASLRGTREETLDISAIREAVVQTHRSSGKNGTSTLTSRAALRVTGRAEPLALTMVYSSGQGAATAVEAINRWLRAGQ